MTRQKTVPLTREARKLRSALGVQCSRYPEDDPRVQLARRAFDVQRFLDLARSLGLPDEELGWLRESLEGEE